MQSRNLRAQFPCSGMSWHPHTSYPTACLPGYGFNISGAAVDCPHKNAGSVTSNSLSADCCLLQGEGRMGGKPGRQCNFLLKEYTQRLVMNLRSHQIPPKGRVIVKRFWECAFSIIPQPAKYSTTCRSTEEQKNAFSEQSCWRNIRWSHFYVFSPIKGGVSGHNI